MRVLFIDKHQYKGFNQGKYVFEDEFGDKLIVRKTKYVDRENDYVYMFLDSKDEANIQLSYSTQKRVKDNFTVGSLINQFKSLKTTLQAAERIIT